MDISTTVIGGVVSVLVAVDILTRYKTRISKRTQIRFNIK